MWTIVDQDPTSAAFVFNVVEFPLADGRCRSRKGVATGWLQDIVQPLTTPHEPLSSGADVVQSLGHLRLDDPTPPVYLKWTNGIIRSNDSVKKTWILWEEWLNCISLSEADSSQSKYLKPKFLCHDMGAAELLSFSFSLSSSFMLNMCNRTMLQDIPCFYFF